MPMSLSNSSKSENSDSALRHGLPKAFLLENVAKLGSAVRFRETFELIINFLTGIRGSDGQTYCDLLYKILNRNFCGTQQDSNCIYILVYETLVILFSGGGSTRTHPSEKQ